ARTGTRARTAATHPDTATGLRRHRRRAPTDGRIPHARRTDPRTDRPTGYRTVDGRLHCTAIPRPPRCFGVRRCRRPSWRPTPRFCRRRAFRADKLNVAMAQLPEYAYVARFGATESRTGCISKQVRAIYIK